ncbi:tyrosine-protein kinase Fer-like isoform X2 [Porites lutea]|uniref:tyrosine-protein kinase Fer-like isoform X2 n=1 Tax=Porites lutea TaxID=51062 RepID=UPI003CC59B29
MSFDRQHLRFSVDLSSKTGHEAILTHIEGELKHLEHVREYLTKRAKVELDYASALTRINTVASKVINDNEKESPIRKAWGTYIAESETKAKLITEFTNILNSTTLKRLDQLIEDKRNLLKVYRIEKFRVDSGCKQESDEIDRLRKTYQDNAKESETGKRKYEEVRAKDKLNGKDWERSKDKYVKTTMKLHHNHNDYVLALKSGNCHQGFYNDVFVPTMLNSLQYLQEEYVEEWKDVLQDVFHLTNCCREEYMSSSQAVQASVTEVKRDQEYANFINNNRQNQKPALAFIFDPSLLQLTSTGVTADELVLNDLTMEKLEYRRNYLTKEIETIEKQLEAKQKEHEQENNKLQGEKQTNEDHLSIIQKEQNVAVLSWHVEDLKCKKTKLEKMCNMIAVVLDRLGNNQPPKFADFSVPNSPPAGEFGQSTPEFRKSARKIPTLFKKRRLEKEMSANPAEKKPVRYRAPSPSDKVNGRDNDSDDSATGEYIEGLVRFEDRGFPSVRELLDYHVQNKIYVTKKSQAILVNPVLKEKDKWEMRREDIILKDKLGQGHFGDVMKGILKPSNLPVAVKSCKESVSETVKKKFLAEAEILKQYDHPNIVKLIGVCADREPVFIVMEFMPSGDFLSYLRKKGAHLKTRNLIRFSVDAASGMEYLESKNCIHRDLAARNCLIGSDDSLKISDFGMSREVEEVYEASNMKEIPVKWTAPEALNYFQYTTLSDIWSFGVLLWETFSYGNTPYPGLSNRETRDKVENGYRMPAPAETPAPVYQLMKDCWTVDPEKRPRFSEILRRLKQIQTHI